MEQRRECETAVSGELATQTTVGAKINRKSYTEPGLLLLLYESK